MNPWETKEGKQVWDTAAEYWTWLRGAIRRIWADYPLRKVWKQSQLRPVTPEERAAKIFSAQTKNVGQCSFCKQWFAGSKLECDHIEESEGCTSKETAESFLWHCGGLTAEHFRLACKPCHKIQSHSQRNNISYEQAKAEKEAILIIKEKRDSAWLLSKGITPAKNAKLRREQIIEEIKRG